VPGGCGYVGAMLVPQLIVAGHQVTVFDTLWFGNGQLPDNENCSLIKGDVRDREAFAEACKGQEAIVFLASLSSNEMCMREPKLAEAINKRAVPYAIEIARKAGVRRFIYASSVAAYGSSEHDAKESDPLEPTTPYAEAKAYCEGIVLAHTEPSFTTTVVRSASVCGYSLRMRFDLTVNKMIHDAVRDGVIVVNGGAQKRSHINMADICTFYRLLLDLAPTKIAGQVYNAVAENQSVLETAEKVSGLIKCRIETRERSDNRSYTVDGSRARDELGFVPKRLVEHAALYLGTMLQGDYFKDSKTNNAYQNLVENVA
jgi:nucleoside-diphosphate-sugar epimerase